MQSNFIEITLRHECSPVNLLRILRVPFSTNTSGWLLPKFPSLLQLLVLNPFHNIDLLLYPLKPETFVQSFAN